MAVERIFITISTRAKSYSIGSILISLSSTTRLMISFPPHHTSIPFIPILSWGPHKRQGQQQRARSVTTSAAVQLIETKTKLSSSHGLWYSLIPTSCGQIIPKYFSNEGNIDPIHRRQFTLFTKWCRTCRGRSLTTKFYLGDKTYATNRKGDFWEGFARQMFEQWKYQHTSENEVATAMTTT